MNRFLNWARCLCWVLAPVLALTMAAPPLAADPAGVPASPTTIRASAAARVAAIAPLAAAAPAAAATTAATTSTASSFFRSRRGVLAAVLTAAMVGFMAYSTSHDRIKSPAK